MRRSPSRLTILVLLSLLLGLSSCSDDDKASPAIELTPIGAPITAEIGVEGGVIKLSASPGRGPSIDHTAML